MSINMDIVDKLNSYSKRSGYSRYMRDAAQEIIRLRAQINDAKAGFSLAYDALEKCCYDEAILHCGYHLAKLSKG